MPREDITFTIWAKITFLIDIICSWAEFEMYQLIVSVFSTAMMTVYLRYRLIGDLIQGLERPIQRLAIVALVLGIISSFGLSVVGNFQVRYS